MKPHRFHVAKFYFPNSAKKNPPPVVHPLKQGTGGGRGVQQQQHQPTHEDTHRSVDGGTMGPHGPPDKPKGGPGALLPEKAPGPVEGTGGRLGGHERTHPSPGDHPGKFRAWPRHHHPSQSGLQGKLSNSVAPSGFDWPGWGLRFRWNISPGRGAFLTVSSGCH